MIVEMSSLDTGFTVMGTLRSVGVYGQLVTMFLYYGLFVTCNCCLYFRFWPVSYLSRVCSLQAPSELDAIKSYRLWAYKIGYLFWLSFSVACCSWNWFIVSCLVIWWPVWLSFWCCLLSSLSSLHFAMLNQKLDHVPKLTRIDSYHGCSYGPCAL